MIIKFIELVRARKLAAIKIAYRYLIWFLRGFLRGYPGVLIGRNVVINNSSRINIGKYTRIEDFVVLDGFGLHGLQIGANCRVGRFSVLSVPGSNLNLGNGINIGDGTTLAEFCFVGGAGLVNIGRNNSIGQYVSIHPQNHEGPTKADGTVELGISIGNNNWLGAKVCVLDGVKIGSNNTIGAATVVTRDINCFETHVGIPNRKI